MSAFLNLDILLRQVLARGGFLRLSLLTRISYRNFLQYTFHHTLPSIHDREAW